VLITLDAVWEKDVVSDLNAAEGDINDSNCETIT
jgi:hypothetical protein